MLNQNANSNHISPGMGDFKALKLVQSLNIAEKNAHGDKMMQIILLSLALPSKCEKVSFKTSSDWNISQKKTYFTPKTFLTHFWPKNKTNLLFKPHMGSGCALITFNASKPFGAPETKSHVSMLLAELVYHYETQLKNGKKAAKESFRFVLLGGVARTQTQQIYITYHEIEQALKLQKRSLNIHKTALKQTRVTKRSFFPSVFKQCLTCLNLRQIQKTSLS